MIETALVLGVVSVNFLGLAGIYYKLGKVETKFVMLPCYSEKQFKAYKGVCKL